MLHFLCLLLVALNAGATQSAGSLHYHHGGTYRQGQQSHKAVLVLDPHGKLDPHRAQKVSASFQESKPSSSLMRQEISIQARNGEEKQSDGQVPPLGAIVYLFALGRQKEFLDSLTSVCKHLDGKYPIIVVYGKLIPTSTRQEVSDDWNSMSPSCRSPNRELEWVKSSTHDADGTFNAQSYSNQVPVFLQTSSMSGDYQSMIGFWITDIFQLAHRRGLKYIMRLDTDSLLASSPREDPFMQMERTGAVYGYRAFCYDTPGYSEGIWNLMRQYVKANRITPSFEDFTLNGKGAAPMMYTNFEVARVEFFRRADVHKFGVDMLRSGTKSFRLGDAVIRAFQLGLFAKQKQVIHFDHFRYKHSCNRWWWVIDDDRDCVVEEKDPFVMAWGGDPERFGPPVGQCYSSRMDPTILALENGPRQVVDARRLKVREAKMAMTRTGQEEQAQKKWWDSVRVSWLMGNL